MFGIAQQLCQLGHAGCGGLRDQFEEAVAPNVVNDVVEHLTLGKKPPLQGLGMNGQGIGDVALGNVAGVKKPAREQANLFGNQLAGCTEMLLDVAERHLLQQGVSVRQGKGKISCGHADRGDRRIEAARTAKNVGVALQWPHAWMRQHRQQGLGLPLGDQSHELHHVAQRVLDGLRSKPDLGHVDIDGQIHQGAIRLHGNDRKEIVRAEHEEMPGSGQQGLLQRGGMSHQDQERARAAGALTLGQAQAEIRTAARKRCVLQQPDEADERDEGVRILQGIDGKAEPHQFHDRVHADRARQRLIGVQVGAAHERCHGL